jgi:hypothetical protein
MRLIRLLTYPVLGLMLVFSGVMGIIRAQPYDDQTIRAILLPTDCQTPCFMRIHPGETQSREAYHLLESNPWVGELSSHIDSGCCNVALKWQWNGKQPTSLDGSTSTLYFRFNPNTGIQTVQDIAIHTQINIGYVILILGTSGKDNTGALQGLHKAYVELAYPQHNLHVSTTLPCPLTRWQLWQAPMNLEFSSDSWGLTGMKSIGDVC